MEVDEASLDRWERTRRARDSGSTPTSDEERRMARDFR